MVIWLLNSYMIIVMRSLINYRVLKALTGVNHFKITFPDTTAFTFTGECSCSLDAASVNAALTFTANIALNSEIEVTNPS